MKRTILLAAAFAFTGTVVFAQSALDSALQSLTNQGFTNIEVKSGATTAKIEAVRGSEKVEITIDLGSGAVVKSETQTVGTDGTTSSDDSADDSSDDDSGDDNGHHTGGDDSGHGGSGHGGSGSDD